ncbi:sensor histidine kinase [Pseudonocardia kunmingensis]|uniref:histidine kinase n=1 Tax=Pseudonocardia kunmingensis TaxID=630975 RepID=A0A543E002_9PSEU|nr:histidine kinase [Pseudonocardia kunmingensis]TQM14916.1 signal transduction histidine kinase [Pseudonocardia kunmingensis]
MAETAAPASPRVDRWMLPGALADAVDPAAGPGSRRTPRDWAVDITLFLVAVTVAVVELVTVVVPDAFGLPLWLRIVDLVLGGLLCLSLWWRRRFPVALGIAAAFVAAVSNTAFAALAILLFSVALHRGWVVAVPIAAAQALLAVPYMVTYFPASFGPPLLWILVILLGAALLVAAGLGVRARRQLVVALRLRADAERREHARELEESRRGERQRIAREMHDVLAHRISLLSVHAGALEYRTSMAEDGSAAPPTAAEVRSAVRVVRANAAQALEELREVLDLLRQPGAEGDRETARGGPQPSAERLPELVEEARRSGQQVRAEIGPGVTELRPQLQRTVYRIVQEGLTNARKHAPGAAVDVLVRGGPDGEVLVEVANGVPIGVTTSEIPGAGTGLTGLAERVALHGGELTRDVCNGRFRLRVRIPCVP